MSIDHGTVSTIITYYEGKPVKEAQRLEQSLYTDRNSLLKDLIDSLTVLNTGTTRNLTLNITVDKHGRYLIKREWIV